MDTKVLKEMKYETLIEDYHGHCFRDRFEANSDEEAKLKAEKDGYNYFSSNDCLWRVCGDYVNHSNFTKEEEQKMKNNYIRLVID